MLGLVSSLSDPDDYHACSIDPLFGEKFCGCKGGYNKNFCSHLVAMLTALPEEEMKDLITTYVNSIGKGISMNEEITKKLPFIPTSLKAFNTQVAGMAKRTLTNVMGEPGDGKTILLTQLCWENMAKEKGRNVLYFGSEGGEEYAVQGWALKAFNKRYLEADVIKVDNINKIYKTDKPTIFIIDARQIIEILKLHGFPIKMRISEDGKMIPRWNFDVSKKEKYVDLPHIKDTPIGKFITDHKIGMVVYDSISMPNKIFISGQLNLPGRANAEELWLAQMQDISSTYDAFVVASTHITKDDTNKYDTGRSVGGDAIAYNFKLVLRIARYMNPRTKNPAQGEDVVNKRRLVRERFFFEKTGKQAGVTTLELDDNGYRDLTETEALGLETRKKKPAKEEEEIEE